MMKQLVLFGWPVLALLLLLSACDDPSAVGIGLVDEQGTPQARTLPTSMLEPEALQDVTGTALRVLAGQVDDPLLGTIAATGYVDFLSRFDTTGAPAITGAALVLAPDYVYGDTTLAVTLDLYDLIEDWTATGGRADTTLPLGSLVTTFDVPPGDTLVVVPLPEAWVAANDATLRSTTFETAFHGFALEGAGSTAVLGFNAVASTLRIFTDRDTLDYAMTRRLSGVQRLTEPLLPPDRVVVQDGVGPTIKFNFAFEEAGLSQTPLNGASFRFYADTASVRSAPPHFVRPLLRRVQLCGVAPEEVLERLAREGSVLACRDIDEELSYLLSEAELDERGFFRFNLSVTANAVTLREVIQLTLLGEDVYDHFELRVPDDPNSINVMLFYGNGADEQAPEAILTITPTGS